MAAVRRLAKELANKLARGTLTLVPIVNEPAYEMGRRAGPDGLDLARTCPGRADGSPTEQIAHALTQLIQQADYFLDLHTGGGELLLVPMAGYMLHADPQVLEQQRRLARCLQLPVIWGTDPTLPGRSLSVARDAGVPAIYTEYLGGGRFDAAGVNDVYAGCCRVLVELGLLDQLPPDVSPLTDPHPPIFVEDDRPQSGYLQLQHPAPWTGFFEPSVALGDTVQQGDVLGHLWTLAGEEPVLAAQAGLVLGLRTFARVNQGDALAVILETSQQLPEHLRWS